MVFLTLLYPALSSAATTQCLPNQLYYQFQVFCLPNSSPGALGLCAHTRSHFLRISSKLRALVCVYNNFAGRRITSIFTLYKEAGISNQHVQISHRKRVRHLYVLAVHQRRERRRKVEIVFPAASKQSIQMMNAYPSFDPHRFIVQCEHWNPKQKQSQTIAACMRRDWFIFTTFVNSIFYAILLEFFGKSWTIRISGKRLSANVYVCTTHFSIRCGCLWAQCVKYTQNAWAYGPQFIFEAVILLCGRLFPNRMRTQCDNEANPVRSDMRIGIGL